MISLNKLTDIINNKYPLTCCDSSAYDGTKIKGITFDIKAYHATGLGHISTMSAKGLFGLMKMDTLIVSPIDLDLPIFSYDRFVVMGKDTLIIEGYDTMVESTNFDSLMKIKEHYSTLPSRDPGQHWYDDIKLNESISFKGKKEFSQTFDQLTEEYIRTFVDLDAPVVKDYASKKDKSLLYINGLLENGGPSTDIFSKAIGKERTADLFHTVLFGI